jgi:small GTP-binding protein
MTLPISYKIVVAGASAVGKSSLVQRLVQDTFVEDGITTTGAEFYSYTCPVNSESVKLQIWDTAGQERFRSVAKSYFRNALGAVLVYDIANVDSFDQLGDWLSELRTHASPNAYVLLVGNKADLEESRQVGSDLVRSFAEKHRLETVETSARSGQNVKEAFARMALEVSTRVASGKLSVTALVKPVQIPEADAGPKKKGCCK